MNINRTVVCNVDIAAKDRTRAIVKNGKRVIEHKPQGNRNERWIDACGFVCEIQMRAPGSDQGENYIETKRAQMRRDGWVEYSRCPVKAGGLLGDKHEADRASLIAAMGVEAFKGCEEHPQNISAKGVWQGSCVHAEHVVKDRQAKHAANSARRRPVITSLVDLERQKIELMQKEAASRLKTEERLVEALTALAPKGKRSE